MISYIKGEITFKNPTFIIVETGGIGYHVHISLNTYSQIEKLEKVKILTHLHIKEDSHTLYGFADGSERKLFRQLISVSGIGPATAQIALSSLTPDELKAAIISENELTFKKVKGIGPKTAKRIILDLKDKILKENNDMPISFTPADNTIRDEALSALVALGFNRSKVQRSLNNILKAQTDSMSVEELIKRALSVLAG